MLFGPFTNLLFGEICFFRLLASAKFALAKLGNDAGRIYGACQDW